MIELLSRHPDILGEPSNLVIEPLPIDGDVSSLSAIIMDDDFYHFTIKHSKLTDGVRHADSAALVCLKTRAYLNLLQDKAEGKHVNSKDIKKHRSDVLKNVVIITDESISAPMAIVDCVKDFVSSIRADWDTLSNPLAKALDQDQEFVDALLEQLNNLFVPETDAVRNVAWFKVIALANFSCPTILGIITGTIGPMKALQIPVKNIIP